MKTLKTLKTLALCAALTPAAALAQDTYTPSEADLDAFRSAVASVGCIVDDENHASSVEAATGLSEVQLGIIVDTLRSNGEITDLGGDEGGIQLISGECES